MKFCEYIKTNKGYATSCGIVISHIGRKWIYCPHCGEYIYVIPSRLKAEKLAMLEDLDLQIDESAAYNLQVAKVQRLIRDRINALKEDKE